MHRLIAPRFIDPRLMRSSEIEATVINTFSVECFDQIWRLAEPDEISLYQGQKVFIDQSYDGRYFCLETEEEQQEKRRRREHEKQRCKQEMQHRDKMRREEALAFNASLCIPVEWVPGVKDVLSGLSERSSGTGCNAATVYHILLQDDIHDGRLHRSRGDFLCSSSSEQNGKNWSGQKKAGWIDSNCEMHQPSVTCKACLKIAKRFS